MEDKFASMIFFEGENEMKLTDEEWANNERERELQMKKLMTVTKSKFYMLKINYSKIFKLVDFENADHTANEEEDKDEVPDRLYKDLKRSDVDQGAALTSQQSLIQRLKAPINVAESSEKLYSEE